MKTLSYSAAGLELFEQAFGTPFREARTPAGRGIATALHVLESDLRRSGGWQAPRTMPPPAIRGSTESPLIWNRQLTDDELGRRWIVSFDKHAAYLGTLGGLELGIGNPQRADWDQLGARALAIGRDWINRPGYYRVRCTFPPVEPSFPDPLARDRASRRRVESFWITTPTLAFALESELDVTVLESWTWPRHARLLRPFGERCRQARIRIMDGACGILKDGSPDSFVNARLAYREALRALKHTYAPILGGFLARWADRDREPRPPWYRPDWRHHIIARARANLLRNLLQWRPLGLHPIGIYNDAFYVASDDSADELAERYRIPIGDSLGGYSIAGGSRRLAEVVTNGRLNFKVLFARERLNHE